jgi:hypothetical protein
MLLAVPSAFAALEGCLASSFNESTCHRSVPVRALCAVYDCFAMLLGEAALLLSIADGTACMHCEVPVPTTLPHASTAIISLVGNEMANQLAQLVCLTDK